MKKLCLVMFATAICSGSAMAQKKKTTDAKPVDKTMQMESVAINPDEPISFKTDQHAFGTVEEGPAAEYEFKFVNAGKEPIIVQRVQTSCGCTTPFWSKEPIAPGKEGIVKASYGTTGRPGDFTKTLTVFYNVGSDETPKTKVLTISGSVEKAPTSSVPENNSMMKTH